MLVLPCCEASMKDGKVCMCRGPAVAWTDIGFLGYNYLVSKLKGLKITDVMKLINIPCEIVTGFELLVCFV